MIHCVAGTAGHIDHGKTALVRALTGIDTDRLEEEKRRGISIDLGFAHLALSSDVECGFVDVPGHERFVKNMLAGVGGIDLVLLVVSADESIKPQTREHFDICRLLGIERGIVVITKADLVDADLLDLVRLEVEEFVAGSFLENAPRVAVSAVTGQGIDELKREIVAMARRLPQRDTTRHFRLPVDRAFAMKGFGAVVTGTLIAGAVSLEQEVEIYPAGRKARVRGIQVHGHAVPRAVAGQRTALNLAGIDHTDIARGHMLAEPGRFHPTAAVDCVLDLLASAKPLKHRAPVHFHAATSEVLGEVRLAQGTRLDPGARGHARILLREPLLLLPGDRFILRMFSPVITIAGGRILDPQPPRKPAPERWQVLDTGTAAEKLAWWVKEAPLGTGAAQLVSRTGLKEKEVLAGWKQPGLIVFEGQDWAIGKERLTAVHQRLQASLAAFHKQNPLQPGMSKEDLRSRELAGAPPFLLDLILKQSPLFATEGEFVRLSAHKVAYRADEEQALGRIESAFQSAGLTVPSAPEVLKSCGVDATRARTLLQILLREKRLIRISEDLLFHPSAIGVVRQLLAGRKGTRFSVADFKDWTGVSRKYAIPLLEFLDRERLTRRDGEVRVVL